ncbi:hypothetical protein [Vampirovibrio sp.]|uniref:hypothetical protein n=1 Tax=Vampirovibrio sp. TaxID=2717857 RepID=UPI003594664F
MLRVCHVSSLQEWAVYQPGIEALLQTHHPILLDDYRQSGNLQQDIHFLSENTAACLPWLWVLADETDQVWAIIALSDIQPGRHAFLHGATHSHFRENKEARSAVERLLLPIFQAAFGPLALLKLKAEFELDNAGAKGFCLRWGFQREALFKADIKLGGCLRDVAIYSVSANRYQGWLLPRLLRGVQKRQPLPDGPQAFHQSSL